MSTADERIAYLERQVEMLLAANAALKAENAELRRRLGQNSSNSSKPPSSDSPADREKRPAPAPSGRRRGGQPGHKGTRRELLPANEVDSVDNFHPAHCRRCARGLPKRLDPEPALSGRLQRYYELEFSNPEATITFWSTGYQVALLTDPVISTVTSNSYV